ncbi:hypothetical protein [Paraburkholderia sp. SIMBA_054]|uniref:hypothetical protein n=1 Tax=Paraburkholderia sp. SIMBA_054 TaxID=3085795 RepID=UPI00397B1FF8
MEKMTEIASRNDVGRHKFWERLDSLIPALVLGTVAILCVGFGIHKIVESSRAEAAQETENARVLANIDTFLPAIFRATTVRETFSGLTPEVRWTGESATILGWVRDDQNYSYPRWAVLARAQSGRYYQVKFALCDSCDVSVANHGPNRLRYFEFDKLTSRDAKVFLYRANLRDTYRKEFGVDAPPAYVNG